MSPRGISMGIHADRVNRWNKTIFRRLIWAHLPRGRHDLFVLMEGQSEQTHAITPGISFVVDCKTQEEVDRYWENLTKGGAESQCGWLTDRYGISWQIVPSVLGELLSHPDPIKAEKVMKTMLTMKKLDIEKLKAAAVS